MKRKEEEKRGKRSRLIYFMRPELIPASHTNYERNGQKPLDATPTGAADDETLPTGHDPPRHRPKLFIFDALPT